MAKRKDSKVVRARNTIIGFITLVVIMILGFGTYVTTPLSNQEVTADSDYREVDNPKSRRAGDPVEIVEFFSYRCIHCKNFDPLIEEWAAEQGDAITFKRSPVMYSPVDTMLGRTYLALEKEGALEDNHARIFRAIHDANRQFLTPEMMADYVDGRGVSREDFLRTFNSPSVRDAATRSERDVQRFIISATPMVLVGGRYVVSMQGGQGRAIEVVDHLVKKIQAEESGTPTT